jgi:hypothetical protein
MSHSCYNFILLNFKYYSNKNVQSINLIISHSTINRVLLRSSVGGPTGFNGLELFCYGYCVDDGYMVGEEEPSVVILSMEEGDKAHHVPEYPRRINQI